MPDKSLSPYEEEQNRHALRHVKAWLKFRDMTQRRLADDLGMSEPAVSKWLRGKQAMSVAQFVRVAQLLDAKPDELLFAPTERAKALRYAKLAEGLEQLTDAQLAAVQVVVDGMRKI